MVYSYTVQTPLNVAFLLSTKVDPPNLAFCANKATSIFIQLWKDASLLSISDGVNHLLISSPSLAYADHVEITWANKATIRYLIVCLLEVLVKLWNWQRHSCTSYVMLSIVCPTVPSCGENGIKVGNCQWIHCPWDWQGGVFATRIHYTHIYTMFTSILPHKCITV